MLCLRRGCSIRADRGRIAQFASGGNRHLSLTTTAQATVKDASTVGLKGVSHDIDKAWLRIPQHRRPAYWQQIPRWSNIPESIFLKYDWQSMHSITNNKMSAFLREVLPVEVPGYTQHDGLITRDQLINDVALGLNTANMALRITPHIASLIRWTAPLQCPVFRQFVCTAAGQIPDHQRLSLDSLNERADSPVSGLVHRYPDKVLLISTAVCPVYCRFCTRSYAVGAHTSSNKKHRVGIKRSEQEEAISYIREHTEIRDVVISGGDTFYLHPDRLRTIGEQLLAIPHVRELRFASKGLAVCPSRHLDPEDEWTAALLQLSRQARDLDKEIALHTHINSAQEITWVTHAAASVLFRAGLTVRNQTVLLKGVNDTLESMSSLIRTLADMHIQPLYVYQADMVKGTEDLRTPLSTAIQLQSELRGTIAGHRMPAFVVDLPGGGGKQLVNSYLSYNRDSGISTFESPAVRKDELFEYHDPLWSRSQNLAPLSEATV